MKHLILVLVIFLQVVLAYGQQQQVLTQYFNHILTFNPAYAGHQSTGEVNVAYRNQWLGLEGSPEFQLANFNTSLFDDRVGAGIGLMRSSMAISSELTANAYYSYRIQFKPGVLSLGVQASVKNFTSDFNDSRIVTTQPRDIDPSIPMENGSVTVPNFGFGIFFNAKNYFLGLSAPRMLQNNIDFAGDGFTSRERLHSYFTAGYSYEVNREISIQTTMLAKYVQGSPLDLDLTLFFRFVERMGFGMNYRFRDEFNSLQGESLSFIINASASSQLMIGFSYDMALSRLKDFHGGSLELFVRYNLPEGKDKSP